MTDTDALARAIRVLIADAAPVLRDGGTPIDRQNLAAAIHQAAEAADREVCGPLAVGDTYPSAAADSPTRQMYKRLAARFRAEDAADPLTPSSAEVGGLDVDLIRKALAIGYASWDGDHWYAENAGWDFEDAETTLDAARAALAAYAAAKEAGGG